MADKVDIYKDLEIKIESVLKGNESLISSMATLSCMLKENLPGVLWAGFYIYSEGELHVGPYQGSLGCTTIKVGKGVCGVSFEKGDTLIVPDVHKFEGHIACDSNSNSEIVVPIFNDKREKIAVLDLDSSNFNQFDETDRMYLERIAELLARKKKIL